MGSLWPLVKDRLFRPFGLISASTHLRTVAELRSAIARVSMDTRILALEARLRLFFHAGFLLMHGLIQAETRPGATTLVVLIEDSVFFELSKCLAEEKLLLIRRVWPVTKQIVRV